MSITTSEGLNAKPATVAKKPTKADKKAQIAAAHWAEQHAESQAKAEARMAEARAGYRALSKEEAYDLIGRTQRLADEWTRIETRHNNLRGAGPGFIVQAALEFQTELLDVIFSEG